MTDVVGSVSDTSLDADMGPYIVPLVGEGQLVAYTPLRGLALPGGTGERALALSEPGWRERVHLFSRSGGRWERQGAGGEWRVSGKEVAFAALPSRPGERDSLATEGTLTVRFAGGKGTVPLQIAPVLLASPLDPVEEVWVVKNRLTERFVAELERLVPACAGKPRLRTVDYDAHPSDIWMQDTVEFGVAAVPDGRGNVRQTTVALLGLRGKHDMGLTCGPLDAFVRETIGRECSDVVRQAIGEPRSGARWIDWYGNLEVSPPIPGHPYGRVLTGEQRGLTIHPDLLAFLEAQRLQWPPVFLNVGWLTIGHVDELVNFVPAPGGRGFVALMPSPKLAADLLQNAVESGHGSEKVFAGRDGETTVGRLLEEVGRTAETEAIEAAVAETRRQLQRELELDPRDFIALPVLFKAGLSVIPNGVNGLVVGRDYFLPAPDGPCVAGRDIFETAIRARLARTRLRLHFLDIYEPYHVRSGEIHCGTNAIRRRRDAKWWQSGPVQRVDT